MANRRFIDFPIAASVGDNDIVLIWQDGLNKQTTKATLLQGSPSSLAGLTDVDIAGLINGQILQYNSTTSKWENVDRTDINLSELGDVTIVAPTNGQVLVYNSSTSKWENSSGGYVPYTGAVTTVNLGAQSILAGSFVKAGGTSAQFLKADGSVDSSTYGTGTVTSVALTMPSAFSVANSPVTTAGTLAVTATGTTSQYIRGDGSLETFPSLTGFVPYTGATADVNLGTHDLAAERGTFANNGSSDTLTVNHTSGSGYGIIVTKGGNNEALYVSKTRGSGNAMTVVGGRTSLVDLALSSVTNTAGDFLTLSGGVVHKRTAAQTLTDIGGQAALTNPVTGTGTSGQVAYFTGTTTISSESNLFWDATNDRLGIGVNAPSERLEVLGPDASGAAVRWRMAGGRKSGYLYSDSAGVGIYDTNLADAGIYLAGNTQIDFRVNGSQRVLIYSDGNVSISNSPSNAGFKLDVNGTGRFTSSVTSSQFISASNLSNSQLNTGSIEIQSYVVNNSWVGDNVFYNGSNFIRRNTGYASQLYFETSGAIAFFTSISAAGGTTPTFVRSLTLTNAGAATFSSSVTALRYIANAQATYASLTYEETFKYASSPAGIWFGNSFNSNNNVALQLRTSNDGTSVEALTITSTGAATFTSSVALGQTISTVSTNSILYHSTNNNLYIQGGSAGLAMYSDGGRSNAAIILESSSKSLFFGTDSVTRLTITSVGRGLFNTNTPSAGASGFNSKSFQVNAEIVSIGFTAGLFWENRSGGVTDTSNWYGWYTSAGTIYLYNGAGNIASINTTTGAYTALSDKNKKKDFEQSTLGLNEILNLKPTLYRMNSDSEDMEKQLGFLAQEVKEYIPQAYVESEDFIGLNYNSIIPVLVNAIKELKQEIDTLKN
jgi:hypothetical protein